MGERTLHYHPLAHPNPETTNPFPTGRVGGGCTGSRVFGVQRLNRCLVSSTGVITKEAKDVDHKITQITKTPITKQ
jgi:hypothetical protein